MSSEAVSEIQNPSLSTMTPLPLKDSPDGLDSIMPNEESDDDEMPVTPSEPLDNSKIPCKLLSQPGGCHRRNCRFSHNPADVGEEIGRCNICFEEKFKVYGLLSGCSHVFSCARKWRNTKVGESARKCPVCRQTSQSITPSATFFPVGDKREEFITVHKSLKSKTSCRYFENSKKGKGRLHCPMLNKCDFAHLVDGQPHVFSPREIKRIKLARRMKLPIDERTQRLVMERQERSRRRQLESRRTSSRISQRNGITTQTRAPIRTITASTLETLERRRVTGALMDAEFRAAAAESRLATIQSNVNQIRELLDQFHETAVLAGLSRPTENMTGTTTTPATRSADNVELTRNMVQIGQRWARNTRETRGHARHIRDNRTTVESLSLEMPGATVIPQVILRTQSRTSMEDVREEQGSPQRNVPRTRTESMSLEDFPGVQIIHHPVVPRTTSDPLRMEGVEGVRVPHQVASETGAEPRVEDIPGLEMIGQHPIPRTNTNGSGNIGTSSVRTGESGIDRTMAEIRNRQWEELRMRLASRVGGRQTR